jgi:soluble lytic murein transglycosylase
MKDGGWMRIGSLAAVLGLLLLASSAGLTQRGAQAQEASAASVAPPPIPAPGSPEYMRLSMGLSSADAGDWTAVAIQRDGATDPLVRRILQWRYASATEAPLAFDDIAQALRELQDWPQRGAIKTRAEQAIFTSRLSPRERVAFFDEVGAPATGDGKIALAQALSATGKRSEGVELARAAWRDDTLTDTGKAEALSSFSGAFEQSDYAARANLALWRGHRTEAQQLASRLSPADRLLVEARIALQTSRRRGLQAAVDAVPSSREDDPGLLYDRTRYVRRSGRPEDAMVIAARISPMSSPLATRDEIAEERRLYVPRALRAGQRTLAYQLVTNHGLTSGEDFADAEWMAGWLSLRYRNDARQALTHFSHLSDNVSSPVSKARALYWRAEAEKALNQNTEAQAHLAEAARYNYTYYGQIAASKLGAATLSLDSSAVVSRDARARFESRELVRALRLISNMGDRADFESIAFYLDDKLDDPQELEALSQLARERAYYRTALRSAKAGLFRGVVAANAAYPIMTLPEGARMPGRAEPALTHAIIRQESEFDTGAVSSASARGLMQLMPTTARMQARREGMSYSGPAMLTNDPDYNVTLGAAHLGDLVSEFGGSYVLAIAAYNAGGHRAREWIGDWGDPRSSSVDVVDWVELIPFNETRNYVQRVMENLQVYRHRLAGTPTPITIEQDLRRGRF